MAQENVVILVRHARTTAADRRARIRAEKLTTLCQGPKKVFAILHIPDRPRKHSPDAPHGPSEEVLADLLHNERVDFSRLQSNAQLCIDASTSSNKAFANPFRKVNEAENCLINRHAKIATEEVRGASLMQSQTASEDVNAAFASPRTPPAMTRWPTTRKLTASLPHRTPRRRTNHQAVTPAQSLSQ